MFIYIRGREHICSKFNRITGGLTKLYSGISKILKTFFSRVKKENENICNMDILTKLLETLFMAICFI
jgi:hypothetical protein